MKSTALVEVISIAVQMDDVFTETGCVMELRTVHLEMMNCRLSAIAVTQLSFTVLVEILVSVLIKNVMVLPTVMTPRMKHSVCRW